LLFLIVFLVLLIVVLSIVKRKSIKEVTGLGAASVKARYRWDHASPAERKTMLAAIDICVGEYRDSLVPKDWTELPNNVRISLSRSVGTK
jgi:hypothetical protein